MKISNAVIIFATNVVILTIIFLVLYFLVKPLVYVTSPIIQLDVTGQTTVYLTQTSQPLTLEATVSTNPYQAVIYSKVTIPSSSVGKMIMFPSSRSSSYQPPFNNNIPVVFTAMTNLLINEGDEVETESLLNIRQPNTNRTVPPTQKILYHKFKVDKPDEKFLYLTPRGIVPSGHIINNVSLVMVSPAAGNLSLRLQLQDDTEVEICYIEDDNPGAEGLGVSTFFTNQKIVLYDDATAVSGYLSVPEETTEIKCTVGGIVFS